MKSVTNKWKLCGKIRAQKNSPLMQTLPFINSQHILFQNNHNCTLMLVICKAQWYKYLLAASIQSSSAIRFTKINSSRFLFLLLSWVRKSSWIWKERHSSNGKLMLPNLQRVLELDQLESCPRTLRHQAAIAQDQEEYHRQRTPRSLATATKTQTRPLWWKWCCILAERNLENAKHLMSVFQLMVKSQIQTHQCVQTNNTSISQQIWKQP